MQKYAIFKPCLDIYQSESDSFVSLSFRHEIRCFRIFFAVCNLPAFSPFLSVFYIETSPIAVHLSDTSASEVGQYLPGNA